MDISMNKWTNESMEKRRAPHRQKKIILGGSPPPTAYFQESKSEPQLSKTVFILGWQTSLVWQQVSIWPFKIQKMADMNVQTSKDLQMLIPVQSILRHIFKC